MGGMRGIESMASTGSTPANGAVTSDVAWSKKARRWSKKPPTLRMPTGFEWNPSCCQVMISSVSSSVPYPPGMVMNPSASANIMAFRVCMSPTTRISPTDVPEISRGASASGMTPITLPERASASSLPGCPPTLSAIACGI